jgi:ribonucleoside-diphosphate reductase alpha chain
MDNLYQRLSEKRKKLQEEGLYPKWFTTGGLQLFESKYLDGSDDKESGYHGRAEAIAFTAAQQLPKTMQKEWATKFYDIIWNGWLSCSTPVLANMGTDRGLSVSCSGGYIRDSIDGFYQTLHETALLTKYGFGTSAYMGDIRPRGTPISKGGTASGILPVLKDYVNMSRNVSQGNRRRGAWAGYIPIDHGDYWELINYLEQNPDDLNIGWIIKQSFIDRLNSGEAEAVSRYQRALKVKMVTGKGYFFFVDKANAKRPKMYVDHDLDIKASQLCSEIMLHSSPRYTYTCVLSSMNLAKWDEWKNTDAVFVATVFLDCVAGNFIVNAESIRGIERAVEFTKKGRALGLGACGLHTYMQSQKWSFGSLEAHMWNNEAFKHMHDESLKASQWMAKELGEPEWCKGYGVRNTHRLAVAPTKQTALIMGGVSEGINPDPAMTFTQTTAGGEIERITPTLLSLMKSKGVYTKGNIQQVIDAQGSVQKVEWLTDDEKKVFRTAFEINQEDILRLASARAKYIDQWQSLNLFFSADEDPAWISKIHKQAFEDPNILALYYCYSKAGVTASKDCEACQ